MGLVLAFIIALLAVALDQLTKYIVVSDMFLGQTVPIIKDVFHFTYVRNTGAAFSILSGGMTFFYIITPIALAIFIYIMIKERKGSKLQLVLLGGIVGGTIGNFIDRIAYGYVIDFIDCRFINFAIFNVADMFLTCGVFLYVFYLLVELTKDIKKEKKND